MLGADASALRKCLDEVHQSTYPDGAPMYVRNEQGCWLAQISDE